MLNVILKMDDIKIIRCEYHVEYTHVYFYAKCVRSDSLISVSVNISSDKIIDMLAFNENTERVNVLNTDILGWLTL